MRLAKNTSSNALHSSDKTRRRDPCQPIAAAVSHVLFCTKADLANANAVTLRVGIAKVLITSRRGNAVEVVRSKLLFVAHLAGADPDSTS